MTPKFNRVRGYNTNSKFNQARGARVRKNVIREKVNKGHFQLQSAVMLLVLNITLRQFVCRVTLILDTLC